MIYDVVIIGGATAGLTAGIYCGRKKLNTIILTKEIGGQNLLTSDVENYPGFELITGPELTDKISKQAEKYGAVIKTGVEVINLEKLANNNFKINTKEGEGFEARAVIIATGKKPRRLNIPGEKEFEGKGLGFCSICDAPMFGGKDVVVVGGGNAGLESALDLAKYANKIYVFESEKRLRGDEILQERLVATGKVEILKEVELTKIEGTNFIEKVLYKNKATGEEKQLSVQGVFVHIGWLPSTEFIKDFLPLNSCGEVKADREGMTSVPGVFVAGDVLEGKYKQYAIAVGDGAKAALSAYDYLLSQ